MRVGLSATWLQAHQRRAVIRAMLALNLVALSAMYLSGQWDAAEHAQGAVDRFWYPPHFGIYFSLLAAALLAGVGLTLILRTPGGMAGKLRQNAALVFVVVANGLNVTAAPFDAWWHTAFGIDLTVWSPPHLHLLIGTVMAGLGCAVYFLDDDPVHAPLRPLRSLAGRQALTVFALLLALLLGSYIFLEYEGGLRSFDVLRRPRWAYPILWSAYTLFMLALCAAATRRIGMVTLLAALYGVARLGVVWLDRALFDYEGMLAYPLIVPALAFDLGLLALRPRRRERHRRAGLAVVGLLVSALVAVSAPAYWQLMEVAPELNVYPWERFWPSALAAGVLGTLAGWWCGIGMRRLRPVPERMPG